MGWNGREQLILEVIRTNKDWGPHERVGVAARTNIEDPLPNNGHVRAVGRSIGQGRSHEGQDGDCERDKHLNKR